MEITIPMKCCILDPRIPNAVTNLEMELYRVSKIKSVKKKRLELGREAYLTPH